MGRLLPGDFRQSHDRRASTLPGSLGALSLATRPVHRIFLI
ncbi:hypothetical protein CHY_0532 [Carboxydothermus hydrogenoformans Z-2901]|uniref:Uncharacterized protein n=1 Tax=Carboxydothermus hydrogenoformans (strain ATCC BAA-161 / DSM 6008 / Z-2901) TaxID=246194 RepID=Q3AEP4_CARHZ|nr:hypothetical protein CHY_0532 [Carboxydothermus hydrogenoformans Z-2901]